MRPSSASALRPQGAGTAPALKCITAIVAAIALSLAFSPPAPAAPAPCGGVVQISDDRGDGHHPNTDVLSAWFSEQASRPQAVIAVNLGSWAPAHDDSDAAGFAVVFAVGGRLRYVRAEGPRTDPTRYDFGTWTLAGGFSSEGATAGEVTTGFGATVTIDVPAATGAVTGAVLARPFVLTYDGMTSPSDLHWVDRAPGGVTPTEASFGADYVVGSCLASGPGGPGAGGSGEGTGSGGAATTTAVVLSAPRRLRGAGRIRAGGRIVPARGGVTVRVTARARHSRRAPVVRSVRTLTDGSFAASIPLVESSMVTAAAEGINGQTRAVTMQSTVRMTARRLPSGAVVVSGRVSPRLPGRVLLLRTNAVRPSAVTRARNGRFRFSARPLARGRYQAVFIPSGQRAERSTSRSGVLQ